VGVAGQSAVLIYEQGGITDTIYAVVFSHVGDGDVWKAGIDDYSVKDIAGLRNAVQHGKFEPR
jgi:hypothetical protein